MKRKIYKSRIRFLLIRYKDDKVAVIHTVKPFNDINEFPKHAYNPVECKEISFIDYLYLKVKKIWSKSIL